MKNRVFIQAAEQISMQQPMSLQWMNSPECYEGELYVRSVDPVFRNYISGNEVRRMGSVMKRALVTSLKVLSETGIEHPDAIITGTCFGCMDYTNRFLNDMIENGEQTLSPTYFMQSTHNTVGSTLGIYTKTHGYNATYSHGGTSFELAVFDACMQMWLGKIRTALVGGHDEMIESFYSLFQKTGYVGIPGMVPCGEVSVSMLLAAEKSANTLCELAGICICHRPAIDELRQKIEKMLVEAGLSLPEVGAVMTGINGNVKNDAFYHTVVDQLFKDKLIMHYKHLFGENFTAPAFSLYASAHCLHLGIVPPVLRVSDAKGKEERQIDNLLLINQEEGKDVSVILLKRTL